MPEDSLKSKHILSLPGLDTVQIEPEIELEKAGQAVESKFDKSETVDSSIKYLF